MKPEHKVCVAVVGFARSHEIQEMQIPCGCPVQGGEKEMPL